MLDADFFRRWMTATAASVDREAERLTALDSPIGFRATSIFRLALMTVVAFGAAFLIGLDHAWLVLIGVAAAQLVLVAVAARSLLRR